MAKSLLVRKVDDQVAHRLRLQAAGNNRSSEAEHRELLREALIPDAAAAAGESFKDFAARFRARTAGRPHTLSVGLLRESRDER